ncbi:MAG: DUF459 domain-containing protein [Alphaproteobacteria bacterium]
MKWLPMLAIAALLIPAPSVAPILILDRAAAQSQSAPQRTERRSFFKMLFGRRAAPRQKQQEQTRRKSSTTKRAAIPESPAAEIQPKDESALRILVVGDFVASALARGLEQRFAEETRVSIVNKANGNSGLVRDDYYNWGAVLPGLLNDQQPDVVVVAIGSNDRQQIKQDGKRHAPLSSGWEAAYEGRIEGIADTLKVFGRPFFWVGAPPMRGRSASRDMAYFNGLYKPRIVETGGYFIDIWNGFTNEDGRFVSSGPDVEGNLRALRNKDGINFSRAGRLKLAFYVEREMKRQIGFTTGAKSVLLLSSPTSQIEIGPDGEKRLVGPVVSLVGPRPGARDALVGDREGEDGSLPLVPGRADDYRWPPVRDSQAEVTPSPASLPGGT